VNTFLYKLYDTLSQRYNLEEGNLLGQIQLRKEIATRLQQAREAAGFKSVEDFCQAHELSLKDYPRHEAGTMILRASQAIRYCELLHISLHWLMLGDAWKQIEQEKRQKTVVDYGEKHA
jgi:hypothetical protein